MPEHVDPQHLLLIGAGPGVGAGVVRRFGRESFRSTLISRGETQLDQLASELRSGGLEIRTTSRNFSGPPTPTRRTPGRLSIDSQAYSGGVTADACLTGEIDDERRRSFACASVRKWHPTSAERARCLAERVGGSARGTVRAPATVRGSAAHRSSGRSFGVRARR
jgi:hypothetical protein